MMTSTLLMQPSPSDKAIWEKALHGPHVASPRQWIFEDQGVRFGRDLYRVDKATLCELALLDIHSQYWETTSPDYLRKYHRTLQCNVEYSFHSANSTSTYQTPAFLKPWLVRVIFMKPHNRKGRGMMDYILNNVSKDARVKLETGNFQEDDWKAVISHKHHQSGLSQMIKAICSERQIYWNKNTGYTWSLPIFDAIQCEIDGISTPLENHPDMPIYRHEVIEQKWERILELSTSHVWTIAGTPFENSGVQRLLDGNWLNDDVINAYLGLCGYLRPDVKFLPTQWFPSLARWGPDASTKSISWISKNKANVEVALRSFTALITVINHPQDHWVTLQFDPQKEILEVFDSMVPNPFESRRKKIEKMVLKPLGLKTWQVQAGKNTPQQEGTSDCGVYACQFAKHLALKIPFRQSFNKKESEWIRKMMVVELADGRVRTPWR